MSEEQLDGPMPWRKGYRSRLSLPLPRDARWVLVALDVLGARSPTRTVAGQPRPDVGWATTRQGRPYLRLELMIELGFSEADFVATIELLTQAGYVVVSDDGVFGVTDWAGQQDSPAARKKRAQRERQRQGDSPPTVPAPGRTADPPPPPKPEPRKGDSPPTVPPRCEDLSRGGGQSPAGPGKFGGQSPRPSRAFGGQSPTEEEKNRDFNPPLRAPVSLAVRLRLARENGAAPLALGEAARRAGIPLSTLRQLESGEAEPTPDELRRLRELYLGCLEDVEVPSLDQGMLKRIVDLHHTLAVELGRAPPGPAPAVTAEDIRIILSTREGAELEQRWTTVLRRWAVRCRRNPRKLEYLTLGFLAQVGPRTEVLADQSLDHETPPPVRGPPRPSGARTRKTGRDAQQE